jgi:GNAT superfamily N-acetyltransferase
MPIRRLVTDDLDALLALYGHLHPDDRLASQQGIQLAWQQIQANRDFFLVFGVETDDLIVASCYLTIIPNLTRGARSIAILENVVTHENHRKRGWGRQVMEHAIQYARQRNCYKVMLLSNALRTEAHRFYERMGFVSQDKVGFVLKL